MCGLVPSFYTGLDESSSEGVHPRSGYSLGCEALEVSLLLQPQLSTFSVEVTSFAAHFGLAVVNTTISCDYASLFIVFSLELNILIHSRCKLGKCNNMWILYNCFPCFSI